MVDTKKLRDAINNFKFYSSPSNASGSAPCTVQDINNVVKNLSKLLNTFVDELENLD